MYFEEAPKREAEDLYDYRDQLDRLVEAVKGGARLIVIEGPRRTGKTSLLLTALSRLDCPSIVIDAREFSSTATITRRDLIQALERGLNRFLAERRSWRDRLSTAVKGVQGVELEPGIPPRISLTWGGRRSGTLDMASLLETLGKTAESQGTTFVLALDEAQEFKRLSGLKLSALMAHVYDYVRGIQWIVTGSQVGVLHDFLGAEDPKAPLFGRALVRIQLKRLSPEQSREFLRLGFKQVSLTLDESQESAIVGKLDGVIGWITYVGVIARRSGRFDETVLAEAVKLGSELAASEVSNFLSIRPQAKTRYVQLMRAMTEGPRKWSDIKRAVENSEGRLVPDFTFNQLLSNLVKAGFVEKGPEGLYEIPDPLIHQAARDRLF